MAKEHEPEPAAAIATGVEGPRTDYEHKAHNADRGNALKTTPHPLSIGHQRRRKPPMPEKMWTAPKNTRRTRSRQHRGTEHEWYEGIANGKKRWYEGRPPPRNRETGARRHQRGHHRHQTHNPQARGQKKSKWYAHTRKHARARYGGGARARTRCRENHGDRRTQDRQRERRKQRRHASAPADRETTKKPTLLPLPVGHQHRRKLNTTSRPARTSHTTATTKKKQNGMNTNANTGMLCATRQRTQQ